MTSLQQKSRTGRPWAIQLKHMFALTTLCAAWFGLFLVFRNVAIVLGVTVIPTALLIGLILFSGNRRFRELSWRWKIFVGVVSSILFLVAYILSAGPAIAFYESTMTNDGNWDAMFAFYEPVNWMHNNTFLEKPLDWYVGHWSDSIKTSSP